MKYRSTFVALSFFLLFISIKLYALNTNRYWNVLTISGAYGRFLYQIQPQLRFADRPVLFDEVPLTLGAGYQCTKDFSLMLGQKSFYTNGRPGMPGFKQFRWYQQAEYTLKETHNVVFFSWLMAEEIQRSHQPGWFYRVRNRFGVNQKLTKAMSLVSYDEVFINLNKPIWVQNHALAQNRLYIGISQQISKKVALGFGYINQLIFDREKQTGQIFVLSLTFTPSKDKYGDEPIDEPVS